MARKKKPKPPGTSGGQPIGIGQYPQPTTVNGKTKTVKSEIYGGSLVTLFSTDPRISVVAGLRSPVSSPLPRPKVETIDRRGRVGRTRWAGRDPYVMTLPIILSQYPHGPVENEISQLESLALRHGSDDHAPIVQVSGPVPFPAGLKTPKWWISGLEEVADRTIFNEDGRRSRYAVDVTLVEYVVDRWLNDSVDENSPTGLGEGIKNRKTTMRKGESFYDVAKRIFHDRSRAAEVARANGIRLGYVAPKDTKIRLP